MSTERLFVGQSFTPQLRGVNLVPPAGPKIVSWSEGTDAEIAALLDAHYAGTVNLHEIWNVGDTRTVHLSAMPATGVDESHVEQDVEFQLVNAGGKELADGRECAFIVQLKDLLTNGNNETENGYMNSTNTNVGGWKGCARRAWCNNVFRNALPETTRNLFKLHKNKTSQGNKLTTLDETEDYFALPCDYNIFGTNSGAVAGEDTVHWSYYDTVEKRQKYPRNNSTYDWWWLRSPVRTITYYFCCVNRTGIDDSDEAVNTIGLAPFGTI